MFQLVSIAILLLPFNGLPIYFLGSLSSEGAFYPLFILVVITFFRQASRGVLRRIDKEIWILITAICFFSLISFFVNIDAIRSAEYMERYGINRYVQQFLQLLMGFMIAYSIAQAIDTERKFYRLIKVIVIVMSGVCIFGFFQLLAYNIGGSISDIHGQIGQLIFHEDITESAAMTGGRLHSVSQEPALLCMFVAVMAPYVITYSVATKRYYHIFFMTILVIFSYSRLGYVVYILLLTLLVFLHHKKYISTSKLFVFIPFIFVMFVGVIITPVADIVVSLGDIENNTSNAARYASPVSAVLLWLESNIYFGVGLGQSGFYSREYLPIWGFISGEIQEVSDGARWPFLHNLLVKILVENGIIGLLLWISLFGTILVKLNRVNRCNLRNGNNTSWFGYAVFSSVFGSCLIMFNRELFSNMNIWVSLGLAIGYIRMHATNAIQLESRQLHYKEL
jgi:O-antigen ligase